MIGCGGSTRGLPAPVGSTSSLFWTRSIATAHRPSGESEAPGPCRDGRRETNPCRADTPHSQDRRPHPARRTKWCGRRRRCRLPRRSPSTSARVRRTRPARVPSRTAGGCRVPGARAHPARCLPDSRLPDALVTVRTRPDNVAAKTVRRVPRTWPPPPDALNQTSSPVRRPVSAEHDSPSPLESVVFFPARSTTATSPRLSIVTGCSRKATRSPFGDTLTSLSHPCPW